MHTKLLIAMLLLALPLGCTHATEDADKRNLARSPGKPLHPIQVEIVDSAALKAGVESEARIVVHSAREIESMQIKVIPPSGMMLAEDSFQRYRPDFVQGAVELPIRLQPAMDGPQSMKVEIYATDTSGRAMSRTVDLSVGTSDVVKQGKKPRVLQAPDNQPQAEEDAVVKGEQEIRRKN